MPQDTYYTILTQLRLVEQQMTLHDAAIQAADTGEHTLLGGRLAATLASAVKAVFVPDVSSQHVEQARTLLVSDTVRQDLWCSWFRWLVV
jgi:tRNA C32,U32 (ribose-2'-O)-methylase TrmJ